MRHRLLVLVAALLVPMVGMADSGTVGCNPGDFATINLAIEALFANPGPHTVTVCTNLTENVEIVGRDGLTIQGNGWQPGQAPTATITTCWTGGGPGPSCVGVPNSGGPFQATIAVVNSRNITIRGLAVEGASQDLEGIYAENSTNVQVIGAVVQNCGNGDDGSDGWVASGISAAGDSSLAVRLSTVQSNDTGVVSGGASVSLRGVLIQSNRFDGLWFIGGTGNVALGSAVNPPVSQNTVVQNNGFGVAVTNGAIVSFGRFTDILNNGPYGLIVNGGSRANLNGGGVNIQGHNAYGILVSDSSVNSGGGPGTLHQIMNNGAGGGSATAGIFATRNSTLGISGANISNNFGSGILADPGSVLRISDSTINGNSGDGVLLQHLSVAHMGGHFINGNLAPSNTTITGNGLSAIACDPSSVVFGDLATVSPLRCSVSSEDKKGTKPAGAAATTTDLELRLQRLADRRR